MQDGEDLDVVMRRADPDRWLSARFASDAARRFEVVALAALNHELGRVAEAVTNPLMGEIRLAWWRESLEALAGGGEARPHPVLRALQPAVAHGRLTLAQLEPMIEARVADLEPEPFADEPALVAYIDATAGALMAAAVRLLDPTADPGVVRGAARAWGWSGLYRAGPAWAARGRRWTPRTWGVADDAEIAAHVDHRIEAALQDAAEELKALPVAAFPAVAYATLARPYVRRGRLTELGRRARLVAAVARGRL